MKCPHCNQEHPAGTKFCPFEGKEIQPQLKNCPNPDCVNFGKNILPNNYKYCPQCNTPLLELTGRVRETNNSEAIDVPVPEKRFKVVLLSADESIFPQIDRIAGTDIVGYARGWWLISRNKNGMFPYTLLEDRVVESKGRALKEKLEALGAKVELQRLDSTTVADFRNGHIFAKNIELGKTKLQDLLTKKYRKTYKENLDDWMDEDIVDLDFEAGEGVTAKIRYLNPNLDRNTIAEIQSEYEGLFINPRQADFSFEENSEKIVNYIETDFEAMPCFTEMGIDDDVFSFNEGNDYRPADEVEKIIDGVVTSNGWVKIDNFLKPENIFAGKDDELRAVYRCSRKDDTGNSVFMMSFFSSERWYGGWSVVFAINLLK